MLTPDLALQAYIETLKFIQSIRDDIPKEERVRMWRDWFAFWRELRTDITSKDG